MGEARKLLPILTLALTLLGACGEIPQPFRHDDGAAPALARPKMTRGVTIRPPDGVPQADALAAALVKQLEAEDIPALAGTGPAFGHVIEGAATPTGIAWSLKAPDGSVTATHANALAGKGDLQLSRTARDVVLALAPYLSDPDSAPRREAGAAAAKDSRPSVQLLPLTGLPGDGDKALIASMRRALDRAGLQILDKDATYVVEGRVAVTPTRPGEDSVTLAWVVRQREGNQELGKIDQDGAVPHGRLLQPWGSLARDIAEGGASGVAEVVRNASGGGGGKLNRP